MPKTVLVVDDMPAHRKLMETALEGQGYKILIAEDGEQALDQVRRHSPDVVLLDVVLPKKNGYQVCRQIKAGEATRRIRVVLISSKTQDADRYWGLKQGADAYITKPFAPEQLRAAIDQTV